MPRRPPPEDEPAPSRGKLRREQQGRDAQLASLAQRLVSAGPGAVARLPLSDELREAVELARTIPHGTGLRRQMRRLTQLLREGEDDAAAIERALDPPPTSKHAPSREPADQWLERLVQQGDVALQALLESQPQVDRVRVRQWLRAVTRAREAAARTVAEGGPRPPKDRRERALRKYLQAVLTARES